MAAEPGELITTEGFTRLLQAAAGGVALVGLASGAVWSRRGSRRSAWLRGLAIAALGPALLGMWWVYNRIEDYYGLDTVRALLTNLGLFVAVGIAASRLAGWIWRATGSDGRESGKSPGSDPAG